MFGWHVTTAKNWEKIQEQGLVPQCGPRSTKLREEYPMIYMFKSKEALEEGLMNWLGNEFNEEEELIVLKIALYNLPIDDVEFEYMCPVAIPCDRIEKVSEINV